MRSITVLFHIVSFQREQQAQVSTAEFRDARFAHELPVQTRRRPSMLSGDYHHAHAAAAHPTTIDRDRYEFLNYSLWYLFVEISMQNCLTALNRIFAFGTLSGSHLFNTTDWPAGKKEEKEVCSIPIDDVLL